MLCFLCSNVQCVVVNGLAQTCNHHAQITYTLAMVVLQQPAYVSARGAHRQSNQRYLQSSTTTSHCTYEVLCLVHQQVDMKATDIHLCKLLTQACLAVQPLQPVLSKLP